MRVCVLQVSYEGSTFEYQHDDLPRDLAPLLPEHTFHHEFLRKATTFRQIRALRRRGFDIYVNLCEGYPDTDVPAVDVVLALEHFRLPYTGPSPCLYGPPKDLMKRVAVGEGVACPRGVVVETAADAAAAAAGLRYPLFVKPNDHGDSLGIDHDSRVSDPGALVRKVEQVVEQYGATLIEEYVAGREFTVLACASPDPAAPPRTFLPLEYRFSEGEPFKTYDLKIRQHHPECNVPCDDADLAARLREAAVRVFCGFPGEGYARMDFRLSPQGGILFLDTNFGCSVFYPEGYEGSADYILAYDGLGQAEFLRLIIAEGLARHARTQTCYAVRPATVGYGVFAVRRVARGEVVMPGEERPRRLVTRSHVERTWSPADREVFDRYAYPVGDEVYVIWDRDPAAWAPQNHSCDPNTGFAGLDVVALRDIGLGEELTIDYATYSGPHMIPFDCRCGSPRCRGRIQQARSLFTTDGPP